MQRGRTAILVVLLGMCLGLPLSVEPAQEPVVRISQGNDLATGDPHQTVTVTDYNVLWHIYDALTRRDPAGEFAPWLATSWKTLNDTTWEFRLRPGVTFANGEPFDASAVKYNLERILDPKANLRVATWLKPISRVEVVNPSTVRIHTKEPFPTLVPQLATIFMVPPKYTAEDPGRLARQPVGTGPYRLVEWIKDDHVTLERRAGAWGKTPEIGTVIFRPIPEDGTRIAALLTGEVDLITNVPPTDTKRIAAASGKRVAVVPSNRGMLVLFNAEKPPFSDRRVRQAVNYAIDKDALVKSLFEGKTTPLDGQLVTPDYVGYNPTLKPYPYDPAKARQLLAEAGYPTGFQTSLDSPSGRYLLDKEVAQAVAGQLTQVGIRSEFHALEWGVYMAKLTKAHQLAPMALIGWAWPTFDAGGLLSLIKEGSPYSYYKSPEFNRLLNAANATMEVQKRRDLLHQAARVLHDDPPGAFLYREPNIYGLAERLVWKPTPDQTIWALDMRVR